MELCKKTAGCGILADWAKQQGRWHNYNETPHRGWISFYDWSGGHKKRDHVGIVESVNSDGSIIAIEGNTAVGNDSNGGEVMERNRSRTYITGYFEPAYTSALTADMVIAAARAELGAKESPANSNNVRYNTWYYGHAVSGATAYPWCCVFVVWVLLVGILTEHAPSQQNNTTQEVVKVTITLNQLQKGSNGAQVKAIQRMLYCLGYYKLSIDGDFGSLTDSAIRSYQKANGLTVDGVIGPKTWANLLGA